MKVIDLRSDTVTRPTPEMRQAMAEAEVGDDVYGEDPTVNRLEAKACELMGKEAALFVPSGSMGNQIAIMAHCARGEEVICDSEAHIFHYEMGAAAVLAGVQLHLVENLHKDEGVLASHFREQIYYLPRTRLVCLENTLNRGGGSVMGLAQMKTVYSLAKENALKVHLDGARIFNAALALRCEVKELAGFADSVMFCLSKGLGAPVGSLLVGNREFIADARRWRKLLGGGMRQAGVLAAAGLVALRNTSRLEGDHDKAKVLAEGLSLLPGLRVDTARVETNMVLAAADESILTKAQLVKKLAEIRVLAGASGRSEVRFVTHSDVSMGDIKEALERIKQVF
ncbi:MAG: low-specificity L-threonine aldolase [Dethiobacter sp.]|jgi:threonine aldolase|nr:low-specificity L-threonine aldolase [Dethiobacter sp.]